MSGDKGTQGSRLVRYPTSGATLSEKNAYKSFKTALLLSNVIDTYDHYAACWVTLKLINI